MTDKHIIIDGVDVSGCEYSFKQFDNWIGKDVVMCDCTLGCRCEPKENHCKFYMYYLEQQLKHKEQECEKLKEELQAQRDFTAHEQKLIYCVAYDESCKTGNDCKQKKCIFKDNIKLKQTLAEIKPILEFYANSNMGEEQPDKTYHIMLNGCYIMVYDPKPARQALQKISEVED